MRDSLILLFGNLNKRSALIRSVDIDVNSGDYWSVQSNSFVEGVSHKIRRQIEDLERVSGVESSALTVDGVPVDSYLTRLDFFY